MWFAATRRICFCSITVPGPLCHHQGCLRPGRQRRQPRHMLRLSAIRSERGDTRIHPPAPNRFLSLGLWIAGHIRYSCLYAGSRPTHRESAAQIQSAVGKGPHLQLQRVRQWRCRLCSLFRYSSRLLLHRYRNNHSLHAPSASALPADFEGQQVSHCKLECNLQRARVLCLPKCDPQSQ